MSDRISIDGDGLIFTSDDCESEYFYIEETEFFGYNQPAKYVTIAESWSAREAVDATTWLNEMRSYPHANILGPIQPVKYVQIDGALLVALRCLVAEFAIGMLILGWLIWKTH